MSSCVQNFASLSRKEIRAIVEEGLFPLISLFSSEAVQFPLLHYKGSRSLWKAAMSNKNVEYTLLWFIENYRYCWHKKGERLESPYFTAKELESTTWQIGVYPRGDGDERKDALFFLRRNIEDDGPEKISVNFETSVLSEKKSALITSKRKGEFVKGQGKGWPCFLKMDFLQDILTVRFRIWRGYGEVRKVAPICARTRIGIENIAFMHVLKNFSALTPNQKNIKMLPYLKKECVISSSVYFTNTPGREGEMILEIQPWVSNLNLCKRNISLIDASGNIISCGKNDNRSYVEKRDFERLPLSLTRQAIMDTKSEYLLDDKLSLLCECTFSTGLEFEKIEETEYKIPRLVVTEGCSEIPDRNENKAVEKVSAYPSVSEDMKTLYIDHCLADVDLKTETKTFPAHKSVLAARSPVFKATFTNDMKETYINSIEIKDLADGTVEQMLLFLYSDEVENLQWKSACLLYYAADKYQIDKLKEVCSSFLIENMTINNAGELLALTDTHSDQDLKKLVENFILQHDKLVFGSEEWEMLMKTNPHLALTTMHLKYKQ